MGVDFVMRRDHAGGAPPHVNQTIGFAATYFTSSLYSGCSHRLIAMF